jgi:hypothetical protein
MSEKTMLIMPGKRMSVSRVLKRALQVAAAVALTAAAAFALVLGNGMLTAKAGTARALSIWLGFIERPDILATMVLTAAVTVLFVYWQRDQERKGR